MVIGVFGGSFNPVHAGHISLAREVVARKLADKVVMVLSPLNPLKEDPASLIDDYLRMEMLRIACLPYPRLEASDIELSMPRPSYTIDTLRRLAASNPGDSFRLVIGADNWECFDRWKDYREILRDFHPIVYPRGLRHAGRRLAGHPDVGRPAAGVKHHDKATPHHGGNGEQSDPPGGIGLYTGQRPIPPRRPAGHLTTIRQTVPGAPRPQKTSDLWNQTPLCS